MNEASRCWDFQQEILDRLKRRPFAELSALPAEQAIQAPPGLGNWRVYLLRADGANGGVKITAEARKRSLLILTSTSSPSFEMLPDGMIVHEEIAVDD